MLNLRPVLHVFALCLVAIGIFEIVPGLVEWGYGHEDGPVYFAAAAIAIFVGGALAFTTRAAGRANLNLRQAFLLTPLCWFGLPAFAALPFVFTDLGLSYTDAYFETVSGFTTTGSTVLTGLDGLRPGILLWRAILQWLGGIGIIVVATAILPFLRVGGMQIMRTESSDRSEKIMPRASQIAGAIAILYLVLSFACVISYWLAGMTLFDAVAHSMTTLATGGYSTSDSSIGNFSPEAQWVSVFYMLLGALPFVLMVKSWQGDRGALLQDSQVRSFLTGLALVICGLGVGLWLAGKYATLEPALRHAAVNVVSIITTTGYASTDYQLWGGAVLPLFLGFMLIGGCTGSTAGGVKIFRWQILTQQASRQLAHAVNPRRVLSRRYNGRPLPADVPASVGVFLFLYMTVLVVGGAALAATGLDFITALSAATTAVGNVGPGLGDIIGPAGTFQSLPDTAKWIMAVLMVMGRLELLTVLVLLDPRFWVR